ncbi:hypothetical protein LCGC14_1818570, partial [marine sediment metagenome]
MDKKRLLELAGIKLNEQERKNFPPEDPEWETKAEEVAEFVFKNMLDDLGHDLLDKPAEARPAVRFPEAPVADRSPRRGVDR